MMDWLQIDQAAFWFALGFILIAIELVAFGMGTGVLLFGSLGAIATGILLWMNVLANSFIVAVACFGISTAIATALLWHPLKRMQSGSELGNDRSSDLIGHTFTLADEVSTVTHAQQKYSGIWWRVEPDKDLKNPVISAGTQVEVTAVGVGVFYVQPAQNL